MYFCGKRLLLPSKRLDRIIKRRTRLFVGYLQIVLIDPIHFLLPKSLFRQLTRLGKCSKYLDSFSLAYFTMQILEQLDCIVRSVLFCHIFQYHSFSSSSSSSSSSPFRRSSFLFLFPTSSSRF